MSSEEDKPKKRGGGIRMKADKNGSIKSKLSGAIMNMGFMKKRSANIITTNSTTAQTSSSVSSTKSALNFQKPQQRLSETHSKEEEDSNSICIANDVDMYGWAASLVGRRSFGGFNPVMEESYNSALNERLDNKKQKKARLQELNDEELLDRYKTYVKNGRTGGTLLERIQIPKNKKRKNSNHDSTQQPKNKKRFSFR